MPEGLAGLGRRQFENDLLGNRVQTLTGLQAFKHRAVGRGSAAPVVCFVAAIDMRDRANPHLNSRDAELGIACYLRPNWFRISVPIRMDVASQ